MNDNSTLISNIEGKLDDNAEDNLPIEFVWMDR